MPTEEEDTQDLDDVSQSSGVSERKKAMEGLRTALFDCGMNTMQRDIDQSIGMSEQSYALLAFASALDAFSRHEKEVQELKKTLEEKHEELPFQDQAGAVEQDSTTAACTESDPYNYPPLDLHPSAIRLVVLQPSQEPDAEIVCNFCNNTLGAIDSKSYEALSYVWGDPARRRPITVGGQLFQATENLEMALRSLRRRTEERLLWIDAICINQNNIPERNEQVQLMGHIYRCARRVIVWLGPESDASDAAFRVMNDMPAKGFPDPTSAGFQDFWAAFLPALPAFLRLIMRPWFTRVWCIQELGLARAVKFQCGEHSAEMVHFLWMSNMFAKANLEHREMISVTTDMDSSESMAPFAKLLKLHSRLLTTAIMGVGPDSDSSPSVLDLLNQFQDWMCSNPKDRVFAFYGLVPAGSPDRAALCPNYSLSVAQVYTRFAVRYLQQHKSLSILLTATRPVRDFIDISAERELPSWVPDWRDPSKHGRCGMYWTIGIHHLVDSMQTPRASVCDTMYDACLGLPVSPLEFRNNFKTLCLDGIMVDKIEHIGPLYGGQGFSHEKAKGVLMEWMMIATLFTNHSYPYTGEPSDEAFYRTIVMDNDLTNLPKEEEDLLVSVDRWTDELLRRRRIPPRTPGLPSAEQDACQPLNSFGLAAYIAGPMMGRRLFRTAKGLMGLGPASVQKDDEVAVIFGGRAPFVLRPDGESHRLMGEW